jgi:hypothetical protein
VVDRVACSHFVSLVSFVFHQRCDPDRNSHYVSVVTKLLFAIAPPCIDGNSPLAPEMMPPLFTFPPDAVTREPTG